MADRGSDNTSVVDALEKVGLAALGAVALTAERADALADELARAGGMRRDEARELIEQSAHRWRGEAMRLSEPAPDWKASSNNSAWFRARSSKSSSFKSRNSSTASAWSKAIPLTRHPLRRTSRAVAEPSNTVLLGGRDRASLRRVEHS
jgi:hypothetical protein